MLVSILYKTYRLNNVHFLYKNTIFLNKLTKTIVSLVVVGKYIRKSLMSMLLFMRYLVILKRTLNCKYKVIKSKNANKEIQKTGLMLHFWG